MNMLLSNLFLFMLKLFAFVVVLMLTLCSNSYLPMFLQCDKRRERWLHRAWDTSEDKRVSEWEEECTGRYSGQSLIRLVWSFLLYVRMFLFLFSHFCLFYVGSQWVSQSAVVVLAVSVFMSYVCAVVGYNCLLFVLIFLFMLSVEAICWSIRFLIQCRCFVFAFGAVHVSVIVLCPMSIVR